jgi:hypothetical protein
MSEAISIQDVNVRSSRYFIARRVTACDHCREPTRVFALVVPPGHEALDLDTDAKDEATAVDTWRIASHGAFLFYIEYLPEAAQSRLKGCSKTFRYGHSDAAMGFYWANHCERCGCLLDDHELFCEPQGAFSPSSATDAGAIHLVPMNEAIEVQAAGYAYEPQFFDCTSWD